MKYDVIVIGGGAAGFFGAIQCAERNPKLNILILERSAQVLGKVKISGGGRCNVTHGCFDPREMTGFYPRGIKELLGPFHQFLCGDMMGWLEDHGVSTKIEDDGRVFPVTDNSQTIIDCFIQQCRKNKIQITTGKSVTQIKPTETGWRVQTKEETFSADKVLLTTGSSPAVWKMLGKIGYDIIEPVPSLFTFNIKNPLLKDLLGIAVPNAEVKIKNTSFAESGPLLITHWGLSGPAVLKLSAWAARELFDLNYNFTISVNWTGKSSEDIEAEIQQNRKTQGKKNVANLQIAQLPKRLWQRMVKLNLPENINYASMNSQQISAMVETITDCKIEVKGKSTFKDEFVTCGGIDTKNIHFKTMESKLHLGLHFAGEVTNIDAITGGFNFQAAWTTAFLAAKGICGE
ncbi:NAD(P)/FAD-dependent oxidoreductase [Chondrinema litorale]|uniref:NAD(P)/FAD-dependent oxidoreductase n=1 Tax=Chondrinema litorale TaxID=2994555 RepID=UPI00254329F2|nr:NAD(P)/FAD-dependent oxidoreductase [Chondrinema litorale]UZR97861.1 NAD(P)/FAD-dependent oxidoreductase [Chondrinema litorale]